MTILQIFEIFQENSLKCSILISFLGNKKASLNQNVWRDHATNQQDFLLHFWETFLYWNEAKTWRNDLFFLSSIFSCLPLWKTLTYLEKSYKMKQKEKRCDKKCKSRLNLFYIMISTIYLVNVGTYPQYSIAIPKFNHSEFRFLRVKRRYWVPHSQMFAVIFFQYSLLLSRHYLCSNRNTYHLVRISCVRQNSTC